jgi:hypothetical protein
LENRREKARWQEWLALLAVGSRAILQMVLKSHLLPENSYAEGAARPEAPGRYVGGSDYGCEDRDRRNWRETERTIWQGPVWKGWRRSACEEAESGRAVSHCQKGGLREVDKMSALHTRQEEVDGNFEEFQKELLSILSTRRGKFALMKDRKITGFYDTVRDALTAADQLYSDGLYSIQQVTDSVGDLGFYSHAMHLV